MPFQPGQSGNPGGRPKGVSPSKLLRDYLLQRAKDKTGKTIRGKIVADQLIEALVNTGLEGDVKAIRDIFDRLEGRPDRARADTDDAGARAALRTQALEMTRARRAGDDGATDGTGRDPGDPGEPQG